MALHASGSTRETVSGRIEILLAQNAAACGKWDDAERLLASQVINSDAPDRLDTLARIAVARGQIGEARRLWEKALAVAPDDARIRQALNTLDSPWILTATLRRIAWLLSCACVVCLSIIGAAALAAKGLSITSESQPVEKPVGQFLPVSTAATSTVETSPPVESHELPIAAPSVEVRATIPTAPMVTPVTGWHMVTNALELQLTADDPLFSYRCELADTALDRIAGVAVALETVGSNYWIIVEGHTDSDPLPPNSAYQDNHELGLYRAVAVGQLLRQYARLDSENVLFTSASDSRLLCEGDDPESKQRNRTAVIRLVPKASTPSSVMLSGEAP